MDKDSRLKVSEIFCSIQGEADHAGFPSAFVRLTGCPLRCQYCDTAYAFHGGTWQSFDTILSNVESYGVRHVCVTGGEPLAQKRCADLLHLLCDRGFSVSIETSGAIALDDVDSRVKKVVDFKTPDSGEVERNLLENISLLVSSDVAKFVICSRQDYLWSCQFVEEHALTEKCQVFFSPSHKQLNATELADWMVQDANPIRLQLQLHKYLWGDEQGR